MATVELRNERDEKVGTLQVPGASAATALGMGMAAADEMLDAPVNGARITVTAVDEDGEMRDGSVFWDQVGHVVWVATRS